MEGTIHICSLDIQIPDELIFYDLEASPVIVSRKAKFCDFNEIVETALGYTK